MKRGQLTALLLALGVLVGVSAGLAAPASAASESVRSASLVRADDPPKKKEKKPDKCDGFVGKARCVAKKTAPLVSPGGVLVAKGADKLQEKAGSTLKQFTPSGVVDEWAKNAAVSSTELLAKLQNRLLDSTKPKLGASWWSAKYAVTYGIGLVVMAITLTVATAQMSRGGPEMAMLARETMTRAIFYVPVVVAAPALVVTLVDMVNALAHWFGLESSGEAGSAIKAYVDSMSKMTDPTTLAGGALTLLTFAGLIFLAAAIALFELSLSEFGVYFLTLLFPIVAGVAVNPRWRRGAYKWCGALLGALLVPAVLFFGYWVLWGMFGASAVGSDRFNLLAAVAVGTLACVFAPIVVGAVIGSLVSGAGVDHHSSTAHALRRGGMSAGRGISRVTTRTAGLIGTRGSNRGGGGGRNRPSSPMRGNDPQRGGGQRSPGGSARANRTRGGTSGNGPSGQHTGAPRHGGSNPGGVGKEKKS